MALKSTIFKANLQIADIDHGYYADHALTLARHPSETDERMMVRLVALALNAYKLQSELGGDGVLAFGAGLSNPDDPDLSLRENPQSQPLGKYGRMRQTYLREHRPILWNQMILTETLFPHLREIDEAANRRLEQMMPELMTSAGVTEALKAADPLKWAGLMNTCKAQAEEVILAELICA